MRLGNDGGGPLVAHVRVEDDLGEVGLRIRFRDGGLELEQGPFTGQERDRTAQGWELSFQKIDVVLAAQGS